jgi:hypothetical protein
MRHLLSKAADYRASFFSDSPKGAVQSYLRSEKESQEDDQNVKKYWANSQLDRLSSDDLSAADERNIFSAHPPFNFIIKYGTQEGSLTTLARNRGTSSDEHYEMIDRLMAMDYNDRLSQTNVKEMSIVLQSIDLTSMSTNFAPGGAPLVETYQFIGRDMYISEGINKNFPHEGETVTNDGKVNQNPRTTVSSGPTEEQLRERREEANSLNDYAPSPQNPPFPQKPPGP